MIYKPVRGPDGLYPSPIQQVAQAFEQGELPAPTLPPEPAMADSDAKLVERLRGKIKATQWGCYPDDDCQRAADRLSSLTEEREKVKTFLARFTKYDVHEHDLSHVQKQAAILLEKMKE